MSRIIRFDSYYPYMDGPVYTRLEPAEHQDHKVGDTYDIEIEDEDRAEGGPYNKVHEAELLSERVMPWRDVSSMLVAYQGLSRSKDTAIERICAFGEEYGPDREVSLLVFLRKDKVKELITSDTEIIPGDFTKEDLEKQ